MREKTLYARLAWTGMRKNRRLYLPYLLSCAGMVLMFYILMGLSGSPVLEHMSGGGSSAIILRLGTVVIAVFALIYNLVSIGRLSARRAELESRSAELSAAIAEGEDRLGYMETEEFFERYAREYLGYVYEGEEIYVGTSAAETDGEA